MRPLQPTEMPALSFSETETSRKIQANSAKIGWLHSKSDEAGVKFDLTIKDALGRVRLEKKNCGNETDQYGELLNMETQLGEELEIVVDNIRGGKLVNVFVN